MILKDFSKAVSKRLSSKTNYSMHMFHLETWIRQNNITISLKQRKNSLGRAKPLGPMLIDKIHYIRRDIHKKIISPHPGEALFTLLRNIPYSLPSSKDLMLHV
jgi:hypothetical protein